MVGDSKIKSSFRKNVEGGVTLFFFYCFFIKKFKKYFLIPCPLLCESMVKQIVFEQVDSKYNLTTENQKINPLLRLKNNFANFFQFKKNYCVKYLIF